MDEKDRIIPKQESKTIVDTLFDNKLFRNDLTRDELNSIEEYIDYSMNSRLNSHLKFRDLADKIQKRDELREK